MLQATMSIKTIFLSLPFFVARREKPTAPRVPSVGTDGTRGAVIHKKGNNSGRIRSLLSKIDGYGLIRNIIILAVTTRACQSKGV
jgi:hypothetical protein